MFSSDNSISVIIPVHNAAPWLHRVLDVLLEIQYPRLEIIAVENASTDSSFEILKIYQSRGVIVARNVEPGVSKARNTGISLATAPFIMFVDADDCIDARLPSVLLETMKKISADMAICDFVYESESGEIIENNSLKKELTFEKKEILDKILNYEGISGYPVCKLFRTEIIKNYGLNFDEDLIVHEDLLFVLKYADLCKKVAYAPFCGYRYIRRDNTANTVVSFRHSYSRVIARARICDFLESRAVHEIVSREKATLYHYLSDSINLLSIDEQDRGMINRGERLNINHIIESNLPDLSTNRYLPLGIKLKLVFIHIFGLNVWCSIKKLKNLFNHEL